MAKVRKFEELILFENEDYVFINKPPFVPSVAERGKFTAVPVLDMVKSIHKNAILCHRLDRETSGILLIAKYAEAYRHASIEFEKRRVEKIYHAITSVRTAYDNEEVNLPINTDNLKSIHIDRKTGKSALTWFNTLENFRHFSLVECRPVTGRLHQIRVHLAAKQSIIAGDELYGGHIPMLSEIKPGFRGQDSPLIQRFALHALKLKIMDRSGNELAIEAPYYKDFEVFLKLLHRYDS